MCDEDIVGKNERFVRDWMSRRSFGMLVGAAGLATLVARGASAQEVMGMDVTVTTPDGEADAYFVHPASGKAPAVIMWPDIFGLRPAFRTMADRLAGEGYAVLVPNPFYRSVKGTVVEEGEELFAAIGRLRPYAQQLTPEAVTSDTTAFVTWLDSQEAVDAMKKLGVMGYCMSGSYTERAAVALPDRVGAGASFHGGGVATDAADSPHLAAAQTNVKFLFAIAQDDDTQDPESKNRLKAAFGDKAEVEVYPAQHGWCPPDSPRYDEAQAEKAWGRLVALFDEALKQVA
jgi:carboxymethylenebutenolidase